MDQNRSTWALREALEKKLKAINWEREPLALCDDSIRKADDVSYMDVWMCGCQQTTYTTTLPGLTYHLHIYV